MQILAFFCSSLCSIDLNKCMKQVGWTILSKSFYKKSCLWIHLPTMAHISPATLQIALQISSLKFISTPRPPRVPLKKTHVFLTDETSSLKHLCDKPQYCKHLGATSLGWLRLAIPNAVLLPLLCPQREELEVCNRLLFSIEETSLALSLWTLLYIFAVYVLPFISGVCQWSYCICF